MNVAVGPLSVTFPDTGAPSPVRRKVASLRFVTGSVKLAVTDVPTGTPVAPSTGVVEETVGGVVSDAWFVVKVQVQSVARGFPAKSLTPVVTMAVQLAPVGKGADGVKKADHPLTVTFPGTGAPSAVSRKVASVTFVTGSVKVILRLASIATSVAPSAGSVDTTVGDSESGGTGMGIGPDTGPGPPPPPPQPIRSTTFRAAQTTNLVRFPVLP